MIREMARGLAIEEVPRGLTTLSALTSFLLKHDVHCSLATRIMSNQFDFSMIDVAPPCSILSLLLHLSSDGIK
jgi:hypothetical protein